MRRIKFGVLAVAATLLASLVVPSGVANAASAYDSAYQNAGSLVLGGTWPSGCSPVDLTYNWPGYITDQSRRYFTDSSSVAAYNAQATSFAAARDHGVWAVSKQVTVGGGIYTESVHVVWSEDPTATLTWSTNPFQRV